MGGICNVLNGFTSFGRRTTFEVQVLAQSVVLDDVNDYDYKDNARILRVAAATPPPGLVTNRPATAAAAVLLLPSSRSAFGSDGRSTQDLLGTHKQHVSR